MASSYKNKRINVSGIVVDKNVITYGDSFICVDNISLITISPIPSNKSWIVALLLGLLGIAMMSESSAAVVFVIISILWLIIVVNYNLKRGENLAISLNSGYTLFFNCSNRSFLIKVVDAMVRSIKEKNKDTYSISFKNCTITGGVMNKSSFVES